MNGIELRELSALIAVAETGQFTEAAAKLGLSQSALTRQIQALEEKIGRSLFSRTTRSTRLTKEGEFWFTKSRKIIQQSELASTEFAEQFLNQPPKVSVGVCNTISLAYLPGFFHQFRKLHQEVQIHLQQDSEIDLISALDNADLDVVIVCKPKALPNTIEITHKFEDNYVLISPKDTPPDKLDSIDLIEVDRQSTTGKTIANWKQKQKITRDPMMEFNNYDLIIHSVSMGLGHALVPHRSLAIHNKNRKIDRHTLKQRPSRELCVLARSDRNRSPIIQHFINNILF